MSKVTFIDNHIELDKVGRTKKLTATRFATVLGLNDWSNPFEAWCEITKTYEKPFEETKYTKAGKVIEPKVFAYLRKIYFMEIETPEDIYGQDYFSKTWGDFFKADKVFGGMWDALCTEDETIIEIKTTKRVEDWKDDIPLYYKLQAALYAYLKGWDKIMMPCVFLQEGDYDHPEDVKITSKNCIVREFTLSEEFPNFENDYIQPALQWWKEHVLTGISPEYDEVKNKDILDSLRTAYLTPTNDDIGYLLDEFDKINEQVEIAMSLIEPQTKRIDEIKVKIKEFFDTNKEDNTKGKLESKKYEFKLNTTNRTSLDTKAIKEDYPDIAESYTKTTVSTTLKITRKEEN